MNNVARKLVAQNVLRSVRRQGSSEVPFKRPTMDDLPIPEGSWQDYYNQQQAKYTKHLILGTLSFITSIAVAYNQIDFNAFIPEYPHGHPKAKKY